MPGNTSCSSDCQSEITTPVEELLDKAAALCARNGSRLTPQRREILSLILSAGKPVGAYDLLEQIKTPERKPAPPTVYRALEFLLEHGLIHRIERLSAFVPCVHLLHAHHTDDCSQKYKDDTPHLHTAQFLICRECKSTSEISTPHILEAIKQSCQPRGFIAQNAFIEIEGLCSGCAEKK